MILFHIFVIITHRCPRHRGPCSPPGPPGPPRAQVLKRQRELAMLSNVNGLRNSLSPQDSAEPNAFNADAQSNKEKDVIDRDFEINYIFSKTIISTRQMYRSNSPCSIHWTRLHTVSCYFL